MSDVIGTFELEHVSNTYTADEHGNITNHTNWRGSAENYGAIFGTLTFGPIALGDMDERLEGGEVRWTGQGFLEDGTVVAGVGKGTWRKDPQGHVWHTDVTTELNDGSKVRGKGVLELATLKFTGTNYSA